MKNTKKIAAEIIAAVQQPNMIGPIKTKPMKPLTQKQDEGVKEMKDKLKMPDSYVIENKGKPKVLLHNPRNKQLQEVEVDSMGSARIV